MDVSPSNNRLQAILFVLAAVGVSSTQDAITKSMSGSLSVNETVIFRCVGSLPVLIPLLMRAGGFKALPSPHVGAVLIRSLILCAGYYSYVLAIAAMPMANGVAIYFTMPFFVAGLAGPFLGERVRLHRWLAIIAAFTGVMVMVRPGAQAFEPAALLSLASAFFYAVGQMMGRRISQKVAPAVMATWQNLVYFSVAVAFLILFSIVDTSGVTHKSLMFLSRGWIWPSLWDAGVLLVNGVFAGMGMIMFVTAYKLAESSFVAPFEYSSMIWALTYGLLVFGDSPDRFTLIGAAVVIVSGLLMVWRDRVLDRAVAAPQVG
jgi:drug/metabolite transporter (DMT)-like permease